VRRMRTLAATTAAAVLLASPAPAAGADARVANERAEADMIAAVNETRGQHGLHALRRSSSLMGSARRFSHWLMENDVFGHLSSIRASGRFALLGEALAMHRGRKFDVQGTLERWMGSPSHRVLVLSPAMRWIGTGVTRGRYGAMPATIWVLHLGKLGPPEPSLPAPGLPLP
jgi:uncharacterized protein YkwD